MSYQSVADLHSTILYVRLSLVHMLHPLGLTSPSGKCVFLDKHRFVTARNEVAKVMFLHVSVCPQGGLPQCMLGYNPPPPRSKHPKDQPSRSRNTPPEQAPPRTRPTPEPDPHRSRLPPPTDGCYCGRYASYWNAFLLEIIFFS